MTSSITEQVAKLLKLVADNRSPNFSGLGVVFYHELNLLPRLSLGSPEQSLPSLPVSGIEQIANTLITIADNTSPWHDGFHLVDTTSWTLTHVSQFLSPTLPTDEREIGLPRPTGARNMTALLVSKIESVDCVGLLNQAKDVYVFQAGHQIIISKQNEPFKSDVC
jgi:hypothetical protein